MIDSSKPAIAPGIVLAVTILISDVFGPTLELIVLLVTPFLCGLLAVYLYSKSFSSRLRVRDGASLGLTTGGVCAITLFIVSGLLYLILSTAVGDKIRGVLPSSEIDFPIGAHVLIAIIGGLIAVPIFRRR